MGDVENSEIPCTPWTTRMPKYAQPNLNYIGKKKEIKQFLRLCFFQLISYIQTMYAQRAKLHSSPRNLDIRFIALFTVKKKGIHL